MRSKKTWLLVAAAVIVWAVYASVGLAQPAPAGPAAPPPAASGQPPPEKPDFPPFDEAMKGFQEVPTSEPPFIPLWYNKKEDALRAQIPAALIGKQFLVAASMSGGPVATGFQLDHFLAYLDRMDKKLVLMRVDARHADGGTKPIADVIKRSYGGDIILKAINIVTMKGQDPIIDLDGVFKADFAGIGAMGGGNVVPALSKWAKFKAFPENVELSVDLAMMRGESGRRNLFHYSISKIPESAQGYQSRVADDRIGYFLTVRKDWSKEYDSDTLFDRYINRWRLEKRDQSLEMSAPKNPIIWYIEKTVPLKYRRWVKEGILEWNRAFEKCGFLDAVEVIQQEDYDARTKDLDPEDVRYNFFRWIVTGRGFAAGPSRAHPVTGQIFDADIVFDDSMVRHYLTVYPQLTGGSQSWEPRNPIVEDFFKSNPFWVYRSPVDLLLPNVKLTKDPDQVFYENLLRHMQTNGQCLCEFAAGMAHEMNFACVALEAKGILPDSDEFIGQILKEVVCHEVGHCLGLRHNFKASTWLPMAEIIEANKAGEATVGSIMDYNPPIIVPRDEKQGSYITRSIGPYDYWAIEYGYRPAGKPYKDEPEMLQKIAARCAEAGLEYATDEDTMAPISPDPLSNRFDMGRDVMDYATHQIELADSLLKDVKDWGVKDGQAYYRLRRAVAVLLSQRAGATSYVTRFPGGLIISRDHKADPSGRPPVKVVDAKDQRRAVRFVCDQVFAEDAYQISPELLNRLGAGRWSHWDSDNFDFLVEFNIHEFVAGSQYNCLVGLMNPFTIRRIHDNELRFGEGESVYTLAEHMDSITRAIWSELNDPDREASAKKPFINSFRRNLQRQELAILMTLVLNPPGGDVPADTNAIARQCVQYVLNKVAKLKDVKLDAASRAHLNDIQTRITKALNAEYRIGEFGGETFQGAPSQAPSDGNGITVLPPE